MRYRPVLVPVSVLLSTVLSANAVRPVLAQEAPPKPQPGIKWTEAQIERQRRRFEPGGSLRPKAGPTERKSQSA